LLLGLVEHVTDTGCTHADEHFHEVGTGYGEKWHLGLSRDGLGQQRLTGTGLANHQDAARNASAQALELVRLPEEVHQLLDVFLGLIDTRDVGKGNLDLVFTQQLGLALAKGHRPALAAGSAPLHLPHEEEEQSYDDENGETGHQQLAPDALPLRLRSDNFDPVIEEVIHQLVVAYHGNGGSELCVVHAPTGHGDTRDGDCAHLTCPHFLNEVGVGDGNTAGLLIDVVEHRQQNGGNHHPEESSFCHIIQGIIPHLCENKLR